MTQQIPGPLAKLARQLGVVAILGSLVLLGGLWTAPQRAWAALLLGSFALTCVGLSGVFFIALQYATGAAWSVPLRRVADAMSSVLPVGGAGILAVLLLHPTIYPWYRHALAEPEGWAGFKQAWLSYPFVVGRAVLFLALWLLFSYLIRKNSRHQEQEGGSSLRRKTTRYSVGFLVVFGVTFWLASTDWVMSLEPNWASTIFGMYQFAGMFLSGLALVALLTVSLRSRGLLNDGVSDAQYLDLGRMIVAFSTFWMYIWFSQYMLIWYANLSEETPYMALRTNFGWGPLMIAILLLNWALPFLLLLPRANKANPRILGLASVIVLAGRVMDLYLMVVPPLSPKSPKPTLWDLAALIVLVSMVVWITLRRFFDTTGHTSPVSVHAPWQAKSYEGRI